MKSGGAQTAALNMIRVEREEPAVQESSRGHSLIPRADESDGRCSVRVADEMQLAQVCHRSQARRHGVLAVVQKVDERLDLGGPSFQASLIKLLLLQRAWLDLLGWGKVEARVVAGVDVGWARHVGTGAVVQREDNEALRDELEDCAAGKLTPAVQSVEANRHWRAASYLVTRSAARGQIGGVKDKRIARVRGEGKVLEQKCWQLDVGKDGSYQRLTLCILRLGVARGERPLDVGVRRPLVAAEDAVLDLVQCEVLAGYAVEEGLAGGAHHKGLQLVHVRLIRLSTILLLIVRHL